jgi:hypothetical protein
MNKPGRLMELGIFEVIHCYGLLYHLHNPQPALEAMARVCSHLMVLETCVSYGDDCRFQFVDENSSDPRQFVTGCGCLPTWALSPGGTSGPWGCRVCSRPDLSTEFAEPPYK